MAGFMFVSVASVVPTQGFMQQNNQKWTFFGLNPCQLFPLQVSCKKSQKIAGFVLSHLSHLSHLSQ